MPKVDRWARLTVRLPAETYRRLEALAEEIPGMTPNALIRIAVEQLTPQLEAMAHALRAARAGQQSNALDLLAALTQAARVQAPSLADAFDFDGVDGVQPGDPRATLARVQALQQEQGQQVREVLAQPQGRALRQALERVQTLQQEQVRRVEEAVEQPPADLQGALAWVQSLQEEQTRWLQDVLALPHGQPLREALGRIYALQEEQAVAVREALAQIRALHEQGAERGARQERFDAAAAFHQQWLAAGGKQPESRQAEPDAI